MGNKEIIINEELFNKFLNQKVAINCETKQEAVDFLNIYESKNIQHDFNFSCKWEKYESETCFGLTSNSNTIFLVCCDIDAYKESNYEIIKYKDLVKSDLFTNNSTKSYTGLEILHMIEGNKIKEGQEIYFYKNELNKYNNTAIWNGKNIVLTNNPQCFLSLDQIFKYNFKLKEKKYITFNEARKSGKLFKYKEWHTFHKLPVILQLLANKAINEDVSSLLDEKVWEIQED